MRNGKDEAYRLTQHPNGHWLWCDHYGTSGGDNISLVQELEPGTGFADAVYRLTGGPSSAVQAVRPKAAPRQVPPPTLPPLAGLEQGRAYLVGRGISSATIEQAERSGFLHYLSDGVCFVGRDEQGRARNVTKRSTDPAAEVQKRDLKGSDKSFPPILKSNPQSVWIVEGGVDALATMEMARRRGAEPPTIIVSGGANVRGFLDNPAVQEMLHSAKRVTVVCENEKDAETQAKTDAAHERQRAAIAAVALHAEVAAWTPNGAKDVAEYNVLNASKLAVQKQAAETDLKLREYASKAHAKSKSKDDGYGLGM